MFLRISLLMLALAILVGAPSLMAWTNPTQPAPNGNVSAPVNTGTTSQVKNAGLGVNTFSVEDGMAVKFLNTNDNNKPTYWRVRRNDGTANHAQYWNTAGGNAATRETGGFAFKQLYNPSNGAFKFQTSEFTGAAGSAIAWKDALTINGDGSVFITNLIGGGGTTLPNCSNGQVVVAQNGSWVCQALTASGAIYSCPSISVNSSSPLGHVTTSNCSGLQTQATCSWTEVNTNTGGSNQTHSVTCTQIGHLVP